MKRHHENSLQVAQFLDTHKHVEHVLHPLLESHPDHALAMGQNSGLHSGMVAFKIKGGKHEAVRFLENMNVILKAPSLGGGHSLACHPTSVTHIFLTPEEKEESGITDNLVRISVGLESSHDLINDIDQALMKAVAI